jgi:D-amino-acid dehydrogenase
MHVVVLGAGIAGVTTACYLARNGIRVTVVDRADAIASGASFANAGQLSYSFTDALARPDMPTKLPGLLFGADPAIRMRPDLSVDFLRWGTSFVSQCTQRRFRDNTVAVLKLALQSASLMQQLREEFEFEFSFREAGKLALLKSAADVAAAEASVQLKNRNGYDVKLLCMNEAKVIEPALGTMTSNYAGAMYSRDDHVGDARLFCIGLADVLRQQFGVEFRLDCEATGVRQTHGRVTAVQLRDDVIEADAVVVCLGAGSVDFMRTLNVRLPIVPVRGYSITLPAGQNAPRVSITDVARRIVFSSMNGEIRIAGFADFVGFDQSKDKERVSLLLRTAQELAPDAARYTADSTRPWGGYRPMTANSRPIVGPSAIPGVYLNCGHGMLGWTLACATGFNVAQQIAVQS